MEPNTNAEEHIVMHMRRRNLQLLIQSKVLCSTCV